MNSPFKNNNVKIEAVDNLNNPIEMKSLSPDRVIPYIPSLGPVVSFSE